MICIHKITDPADHCRCAQTIARRAVGIVLDIQHSGQCDAVIRPATTMGEEVIRLCGTRACIGLGEMVATANEASRGGTAIVGGEVWVDDGCTFCCLEGGLLVHVG